MLLNKTSYVITCLKESAHALGYGGFLHYCRDIKEEKRKKEMQQDILCFRHQVLSLGLSHATISSSLIKAFDS